MTNLCIIILIFSFIFIFILIYIKEKKFLRSFSQSLLCVAIIFYILCVFDGCFSDVEKVKTYNLDKVEFTFDDNFPIDNRYININNEKIYVKDIVFEELNAAFS